LTVNTTGTEFQVTNNGVVMGNLLTDNHSVTGSLRVTGSISGSLFGTSSQAVSSSYALTASFALTAGGASGFPFTGSASITGSFRVSGSTNISASSYALQLLGSGSSVFSVDGTVGRLFEVDDSLSGSLFSVNTAAGLPVIEAFSDNTVRIGQFGQRALFVSQSRVGIGTETPSTNLHISGSSSRVALITTNGALSTGFYDAFQILAANQTGGGLSLNIGKAESTNDLAKMVYFHSSNGSTSNRLGFGFYANDALVNILASGNVGIGTTSPSSKLGVKATGADGIVLEQDAADANNSGRVFFLSTTQNFGLFNNAGDLRFTYSATPGNTSGTSLARFSNTGKYFRMESGTGGIQFNGDTAAANALNDYEEGTWTPVLRGQTVAGTVTYAHRSASYVKIGNYVFVRWGFKLASISSATGTVQITGLPFTSVSWGSYQEPSTSVGTGLLATAANAYRARVFVTNSSTVLEGRVMDNGDTGWDISDFGGDEWIIGELFYNV
jgi:hypothetical protein